MEGSDMTWPGRNMGYGLIGPTRDCRWCAPKLKFPVTAESQKRTLSDVMARFMSAGKSLIGGVVASNSVGVLRSFQPFSQQLRTFVQMGTKLKVVDNSGAKLICCIQALKGRKGARLGDTIVASVKEAQPRGKIKKGQVVHAVVVRAAMPRGRCDGSEVKFDDNAAVIISKQGEPIGNRVFGPIPGELRKKNHVKILTLAEYVV